MRSHPLLIELIEARKERAESEARYRDRVDACILEGLRTADIAEAAWVKPVTIRARRAVLRDMRRGEQDRG